jgi:hypothetical protein
MKATITRTRLSRNKVFGLSAAGAVALVVTASLILGWSLPVMLVLAFLVYTAVLLLAVWLGKAHALAVLLCSVLLTYPLLARLSGAVRDWFMVEVRG